MTHDELMTRERAYMALCMIEQPTRNQQAYMVRLHDLFRRHKTAFLTRPTLERRLYGASLHVIQAACAEPLNKWDFTARIERTCPDKEYTTHAIEGALRWLELRGWLAPAGEQVTHTSQPLKLYTLTREGEEVLDDLWRMA